MTWVTDSLKVTPVTRTPAESPGLQVEFPRPGFRFTVSYDVGDSSSCAHDRRF